MIKVALVGNIASGKSEVEKILTAKGFSVADTDKMAHELIDCEEVYNQFCDYDVFENGKISRFKMGKLVFSDEILKQKLENILHPMIQNQIECYFEQHKSEKYVFVSVPLLFEVKMETLFDKIVFIYADDNIRLNRLIERNSYTPEYAKLRLACQLPQDEKIKKSDYVIYNNSSLADLEKEVARLIL